MNKLIYITTFALALISCHSNKKQDTSVNSPLADSVAIEKKDSATNNNIRTVEHSSFDELINAMITKTVPLIDTTNFDTFIEERKIYNKGEILILQLEKIYPNYYKEGYNYRATPNYKMELSKKFHSVVVAIYKGDHEMESILINYDLKGNIIDSKVISYDEIAEGWSRIHSKIKHNSIIIIDEFYGEPKQIDTTKFHINENGEINQIKTKFSSNLRPNKPILLNQIYTDTIEFSSYNDDGDYFLLNGKKNGKVVSLIYNWEHNNTNKYNFKYGDIIKVKWKMKSISIADDGEKLDYFENVIDTEKIKEENQQVKFLWRADRFDEELKQNYNTIFINKAFTNSISDQEKAALGYVATFIGNECEWDGNVNENRSNLKCEILTALDLGYQCSDKHLGFLRNWFSKDTVALKKLDRCITIPYTATVQTTFDKITLFTDKENKTITVNYKAYKINVRASSRKSWTQTDIFKYDTKNVTLISSEKTE